MRLSQKYRTYARVSARSYGRRFCPAHAWGWADGTFLWCTPDTPTPSVQISRCPERRCPFSPIIGGARAVVIGACLTSDKINYRKRTVLSAEGLIVVFLTSSVELANNGCDW